MCGIVGAIAKENILDLLVNGLQRLEYRGYDSAGVAVIDSSSNELVRIRTVGKVSELSKQIQEQHPSLEAHIGIAHTRWATHGAPCERNAHPHISDNLAVVHNGIIENHEELRAFLTSKGYIFTSQTDTEVICHLLSYFMTNSSRLVPEFGAHALERLQASFTEQLLNAESLDLLTAVKMAVCVVEGAYGMVALDTNKQEQLVAARSGSPLVIGLSDHGNYLASDQLAIIDKTNSFIYLEEGDVASITLDNVEVFDNKFNKVERNVIVSDLTYDATTKGEFESFMLKEIFEQPKAIIDTLEGRLVHERIIYESIGQNAKDILKKVDHVVIVACGTSYFSGSVARYWLEEYAGVSCEVEIASEYRYRKNFNRPNSLLITISQSGETADTLAALRKAKEAGFLATMTICNVASSSMVRESDLVYLTRCGVEIGVASTKAFTNQLSLLMLLSMAIGLDKGTITPEQEIELAKQLNSMPRMIEDYLHNHDQIKELAKHFATVKNCLFIGRDKLYPIAREGDLKLKEISYIHSEAFAGGELKHGPLALVDENMSVIALAPSNELTDKMRSNIEEVMARNGRVFIFTDKEAGFTAKENVTIIELPKVAEPVAPIFYAVPMQLLAYYTARELGYDPDQPRNLAKSVTVE